MSLIVDLVVIMCDYVCCCCHCDVKEIIKKTCCFLLHCRKALVMGCLFDASWKAEVGVSLSFPLDLMGCGIG